MGSFAYHNIRVRTQEDGILKNKLNTYFRLSYINNIDSNNNDIQTTSVLQNVKPSLNKVIVREKSNIDNTDFTLTQYEKIQKEITNAIQLGLSKTPRYSRGGDSIIKLHHQKQAQQETG